jgi:hypothetical protein
MLSRIYVSFFGLRCTFESKSTIPRDQTQASGRDITFGPILLQNSVEVQDEA